MALCCCGRRLSVDVDAYVLLVVQVRQGRRQRHCEMWSVFRDVVLVLELEGQRELPAVAAEHVRANLYQAR